MVDLKFFKPRDKTNVSSFKLKEAFLSRDNFGDRGPLELFYKFQYQRSHVLSRGCQNTEGNDINLGGY